MKQLDPAERAESLLADIEALPRMATYGAKAHGGDAYSVDFLPGALGAVQEAARGRRLTTSSYIRRAALAMAARDLDIPLSDLIERDPRMTRETGFAVSDPEGRKFGAWEIVALRGAQ